MQKPCTALAESQPHDRRETVECAIREQVWERVPGRDLMPAAQCQSVSRRGVSDPTKRVRLDGFELSPRS
jgi:hypothetical protein